MYQKCFNYVLTNLLFGLYRFRWVIELIVTHSNPHPGAPTCPSTPKVLWAKERAPTPYLSVVFTFRLVVESTMEFGGASTWTIERCKNLQWCIRYNISSTNVTLKVLKALQNFIVMWLNNHLSLIKLMTNTNVSNPIMDIWRSNIVMVIAHCVMIGSIDYSIPLANIVGICF
jgi:hypothetical protein